MQYAFRFPLKLKFLNTWCTSTCISMTYFKNQGNSHVSHNRNQTNITIMRKKTLHPLHQFGICVVRLVLACTVFGESRMQTNFAIICPSLLETRKAISRVGLLKLQHSVKNWKYCVRFQPSDYNISKIALLGTKFGLHLPGFYGTKLLHFWNLRSG